MHARPGATPSLAPCPGRANSAAALPPFLGRTAVVRIAEMSFARVADADAFTTLAQRAIDRSRPVEDEPPRGVLPVSS